MKNDYLYLNGSRNQSERKKNDIGIIIHVPVSIISLKKNRRKRRIAQMTKRLIIFLIRKRLGLKKYEDFQFTNQKSNEIYYFTETNLMKKYADDPVKPNVRSNWFLDDHVKSNVSLNWLLDDNCKVNPYVG